MIEGSTRSRVGIDEMVDRVGLVAPLVAGGSASAERNGRLDDAVVAALHDAGLFRVLLSPASGGADLDLAEGFTVFEAMARVDGAAGWNLCVAAVGMWLAGELLPEVGRATLLDDRRGLVAGGLNTGTVRAAVADGGQVFTGVVPFASGAAHATWLLVGGHLWDDSGPVFGPGGVPVLAGGLVRPEEVRIRDTWHVSGLRATSSADVEVDGAFVPSERTFTFAGEVPCGVGRRPLPFTAALGPGLASVAIGIAGHAADLAADVVKERRAFGSSRPLCEDHDVQTDLARARALTASARCYLRAAWRTCDGGRPSELADLRLACVTATEHAARATDLACRAAGSASLFEHHGLERCWRDVHAVTKHTMVSHRHLARLGAIGLGLPAGPGFI